MDIAMLLGGFAISVCQAMDPDAMRVFIRSLDEMADRPTVSPAEAHIFKIVADALKTGRPRPTLSVIQSGVA
jgi:hypothetical protein